MPRPFRESSHAFGSVVEEQRQVRLVRGVRESEEHRESESPRRLDVGGRLGRPGATNLVQFVSQAKAVGEPVEFVDKLYHPAHQCWLPCHARRFEHGRPGLQREPPLNS